MTRRAAGVSRRTAGRLGPVAVVAVAAALIAVVLLVTVLPSLDRAGPGEPRPVEGEPKRVGYVPYWDQDRGFAVVRQHLDLFDEVSPVWYSLEATGEVVLADAEHTTVDRRTVRFLQSRGITVIPTVINLRDGEWEVGPVREMLHDPAVMRSHVRSLVDLAIEEGYDGIDIDYEHLQGEDREPLSTFLAKLGDALRAEGKVLTATVHPKTTDEGDDGRDLAQDYRAIGAAADQVRVMTYDYSWEESPPGPVAPADWVEEVIAWTVTQIPSYKVILGIVLLGYDWADGRGTTVDFQQAQEIAQARGASVERSGDGSPWFHYWDSSGTRHEVWYEDATSVQAKLGLVSRYGLGGAFFWSLGGEDPDVWQVVRSRL